MQQSLNVLIQNLRSWSEDGSEAPEDLMEEAADALEALITDIEDLAQRWREQDTHDD